MSTIAPTFNALSVACPNDDCQAIVDQLCKSKSGTPTKTPHRARVLAAGGTVPALGHPKKSRTRKARSTTKKTTTNGRRGITASTVAGFMSDLNELDGKWTLDNTTAIRVRDPQTDQVLAATYDNGDWLVTMGK